MFFMFMPLDQHYDDGFGATADAFKQAADSLQAGKSDVPTEFLRHLPLNFLRRHACELYLKSGIIIFHRWLNLAYGEADPRGQPFVNTPKGWFPFHRVHSIAVLFCYWRSILTECSPHLVEMTGDDWSLPGEIDVWIAAIDAGDPQSTLFRYPTTKNRKFDQAKSSLKPMAVDHLMPGSQDPKGGYLFLEPDSDVMQASRMDPEAVKDVSLALQHLGEVLFRCHAHMRSKITGGL